MKSKLTISPPDLAGGEKEVAPGEVLNHFKSRMWYGAAVGLTVVLGLCSRMFSAQLPDFVSLHFGDALWAGMVYFGLRTLVVTRSLLFAASAALLFSFAIELISSTRPTGSMRSAGLCLVRLYWEKGFYLSIWSDMLSGYYFLPL